MSVASCALGGVWRSVEVVVIQGSSLYEHVDLRIVCICWKVTRF